MDIEKMKERFAAPKKSIFDQKERELIAERYNIGNVIRCLEGDNSDIGFAANGLRADFVFVADIDFIATQLADNSADVESLDDLGAFLLVENGLHGLAALAQFHNVFHLVFLSCFAKQRRDVRRHHSLFGQFSPTDSGGVPVADSGGVSGSAWPCACTFSTWPSLRSFM